MPLTDPVSEAAGAAKEVAKTTGKAIDTVQAFGGWLDGAIGEPLREAIGWALTDNIRHARAANQLRRAGRLRLLAHETAERLRILGVDDVDAPPDHVLEPLVAAAAREDDPTLQQLWAALLASNLTPDVQRERSFTSILADLTIEDALRFATLFVGSHGRRSISMRISGAPTLAIRKLYRLGLIDAARERVMLPVDMHRQLSASSGNIRLSEVKIYGSLERVVVTETGHAFGAAVGIERFSGMNGEPRGPVG